ncbi:MAG: hypothetical protein JW827_03595 [Spirochaetes bacterium]|nr:hypothetical protein [Spirochaetota bacterium]
MFRKIKAFFILKRNIGQILYILPEGLYTSDNRILSFTKPFTKILLGKGFELGDCIRLTSLSLMDFISNVTDLFEKKTLKPVKTLRIKWSNTRKLTSERLIQDIHKFEYSNKKSPFENYLEACVISYFIQSMNNSKVLITGVWGPGIKVTGGQQFKISYSDILENINSRNMTIKQIRDKLSKYPEEMRTATQALGLPFFNKNHSAYTSFLEYRILQIKLKIILQEICLHSYYMSNEEKVYYDKLFRKIKKHMASFPVSKQQSWINLRG